jgi:integrase
MFADGFRRRIPRTLPKVLEPTAIQKLIDSAGSYRDKAILILLSRAGQRIGDWSPVAGRHGILGTELEDIDRKRRFITVRLKGNATLFGERSVQNVKRLFPPTSRCADDGTSLEIPDPQPDPANLVKRSHGQHVPGRLRTASSLTDEKAANKGRCPRAGVPIQLGLNQAE